MYIISKICDEGPKFIYKQFLKRNYNLFFSISALLSFHMTQMEGLHLRRKTLNIFVLNFNLSEWRLKRKSIWRRLLPQFSNPRWQLWYQTGGWRVSHYIRLLPAIWDLALSCYSDLIKLSIGKSNFIIALSKRSRLIAGR